MLSTILPIRINATGALLLIAFVLVPPEASAWEFHQPASNYSVGIKDFGTFGGVASDSNTFAFKRNVLQKKAAVKDSPRMLPDSCLGLQIELRYTTKLPGSLQLLAKQNSNEFDDVISHAYLQMNLSPSLSIRGGRLPLDSCLLSENRDADYSYLRGRAIPEFYGQFLLSSFHGFDAVYKPQTGIDFFESRGATKNETRNYGMLTPVQEPNFG